MSLILGLESTCDETGAAVVADGRHVRSNVVATQVELHAKYRGVVPEIASRAHIENLLPVIREALEIAGCTLNQLDAIAVAHRPGLIGSLLIGVTAAKTLAWALNKPLVGVDHVHAHLYSVMLRQAGQRAADSGQNEAEAADSGTCASHREPHLPAVGLVVSGGHTALYDVRSWTDITLIGSTIDDAVGEAYDKVAAILGLGYPGGPIIDRLAQQGDPEAVKLPRSLLGRDSLDFSFSGLKTAVLYHVRGVPGRGDTPPPLTEQHIRDIAASFQAACVDTIVIKLKRALRRTNGRAVIIGGGVSANRGLRNALARFDVPVFFPPMQYCTDNAAMTAGLAHVLLEAGQTSGLDLDAITYSQFRA
ncbi:tRNA (adenosine(37)-N6)-threonylcarbamoyltransferase complex transferase subunit TsaD [Fontivita pretiosa]|uniref:tRNA (adenosine(37)-N6)-threonylcarbamoyltransferase complex transferase subunit TsaD n=1 Tax=Fontivita pretiosa TaxID=2989684 RepID=UPI003D178CA5